MTGCSPIAKCFLVLVNIVFLVIGLVFFATGLFLRFGSSVINGFVDSVKESIQSSVNSINTLDDVDLSSFDITGMLRGVALTLIFLGLIMSIVTFLGCCGSCCNVKYMLLMYVGICCILLAGQIVIVGLLYGSPDTIHNAVKKGLRKKIQSDYAGLNGADLITVSWNIVMQKVDCCGVDSYADFTGAANWVYDYTSSAAAVTLKTPLACCKELPSSDDFSCASTTGASDANNYQNTGCYDKIWDKTLGNKPLVIGAMAGICVIQLCLIIFALVIICNENAKENKVGPEKGKEKPPRDAVQANNLPKGLKF